MYISLLACVFLEGVGVDSLRYIRRVFFLFTSPARATGQYLRLLPSSERDASLRLAVFRLRLDRVYLDKRGELCVQV